MYIKAINRKKKKSFMEKELTRLVTKAYVTSRVSPQYLYHLPPIPVVFSELSSQNPAIQHIIEMIFTIRRSFFPS